jgi:hypothetical protein
LSAALRYFSGGSAYDISVVHGISHMEVFLSIWRVVDAVNKTLELGFQFPASHEEQRALARGFTMKADLVILFFDVDVVCFFEQQLPRNQINPAMPMVDCSISRSLYFLK